MDKLLFLYANQRNFTIPTKIQSNLYEKIKSSDFLIADEKGTHRLVGISYQDLNMNAPIITCVCMRHEMNTAKQIAFELNKKIYYDSAASALLFKYQAGQSLMLNDFNPIALLYSEFFRTKNTHKEIGIKIYPNGNIYLNGTPLPPHFKLSLLTELLGEPDKKILEFNKIYIWYDYGLEAISHPMQKNYVDSISIYAQKTKYSSINPAITDISLCGTKIEEACPYNNWHCYGKYAVIIRSLNKEQSCECKKGEIAMLCISFGLNTSKYQKAIINDDENEITTLINKGINLNKRAGMEYETPLMSALRCRKMNIAELLLKNGANPDSYDKDGFTQLHLAVFDNNLEKVKLLVKHGANMNIKDLEGLTPLMWAVLDKKTLPIAKYLIDSGCDVSVTKNGKTALDAMKKTLESEN